MDTAFVYMSCSVPSATVMDARSALKLLSWRPEGRTMSRVTLPMKEYKPLRPSAPRRKLCLRGTAKDPPPFKVKTASFPEEVSTPAKMPPAIEEPEASTSLFQVVPPSYEMYQYPSSIFNWGVLPSAPGAPSLPDAGIMFPSAIIHSPLSVQ